MKTLIKGGTVVGASDATVIVTLLAAPERSRLRTRTVVGARATGAFQ